MPSSGPDTKVDTSFANTLANATPNILANTTSNILTNALSIGKLLSNTPSICNLLYNTPSIRRSREEDPVGLFVYDFDMTIDWNDPVCCARRETLNAMLERDRHISSFLTRQPSRRDVRRSSTSIAAGNAMMVATGRDRANSIKVNAMTTTPFIASMGSSGHSSEYPERRTSRQRRTSVDAGLPHHQKGLGSSVKLNEQDERNMLLHHQVLNPTVNNALLHLISHRSESNGSSRNGSISIPGVSQKSNAAGGGPSTMRISRRESRHEFSANPTNTKQAFSGGGGGEGLSRAPSMNHFNSLSRQQSQHMGVLGGRRRTSFVVGHGSHDNLGMMAEADDSNPTLPDGSKNPIFLIPNYTEEIWDDDPDLVEARHLISDSFRQQWDKGNLFSYPAPIPHTTSHYVAFNNSHHPISGHFDWHV